MFLPKSVVKTHPKNQITGIKPSWAQPRSRFQLNNIFSKSNFAQFRSNTGYSSYSAASSALAKPRQTESGQSYGRQSAPSVAEVLMIDTAPTISIGEISLEPFSDQVIQQLGEGFKEDDVEIKPDGIIYLPEIKYRRILNSAFGAGGWVLIPRGAPIIWSSNLYREYALYCYGKFVSQAVGEQAINSMMSEGTAVESSKSNALMRCCKDLGIASELWDPNFIEHWKSNFATQVWCKNEKTGETKLLWKRKDRNPFIYPWKESSPTPSVPKFSNYQVNNTNEGSLSRSSPSRKFNRFPPKIHEGEEGEEVEISLEEQPAPPPVVESGFDPEGVVPPFMKKIAGKRWKEVVESRDGINYLTWASQNEQISAKVRNLAIAALDWYESQEEPDETY